MPPNAGLANAAVGRPPSLLIVDDEPQSIALLLAYLSSRDMDIRIATDGGDGIAKATARPPALMLLDVRMPGIDGFGVCSAIKSNPLTADVPVLFLSASTDIDDKLHGFAVGGADYISKPFVEEEVLARVLVHLDSVRRLSWLRGEIAQQAMPADQQASRSTQLFNEALAVLKANIADPPGLVALARQHGTNERKLTEVFREHVGMSVYEYLNELRMEVGRQLLEASDIQIQVIAARVGYSNAGDFTRAFRRRFGVGPREYRQVRQGGASP
jgi:YesN/AraC family two-component response regulator